MRFLAQTVVLGALAATAIVPAAAAAQATDQIADALDSLRLREVGPAVAGGRIADINVDPENTSVRYVAVGS